MEQENKRNGETCLSDEEIVELYWERDEKAIKETDKKYGSYLYVIAYNIIHDRLDCEECVNDTYLGTWNRIPPTRPHVFQVFLTKIMRNIAIDRYRQKNAAKRIPSEMTVSLEEIGDALPAVASIDEDYLVDQVAAILNAYLRTLSDKVQFAFVCRYYYADRIANIATMLGVSENTVYRYLNEAKEGLKKELEKGGIDVE
ncbi:MAG: sigma-70 family RNA polymerase sigma factor [Clostridia bacterium]|nr:sigma-70 family RNA polymerase sigma factor [Clostridia bacterium]